MTPPHGADSPRLLAVRLRAALAESRNPDGGWGYYAGKASRLEPTCWATLALVRTDQSAEVQQTTLAFFRLLDRWHHESGLVAESNVPPNLAFNGLAAVVSDACASDSADRQTAAELCSAVARTHGVRQLPSIYQRQNNRLRGWPWQEGTASWTEPTSWCLLALKRARNRLTFAERGRIGEAEAVLVDRRCRPGGWNVGNSNVLGQELPPHVPTTAVALLALQDRSGLPAVRAGLAQLQTSWPHERSGFGLSLAAIALAALGQRVDGIAPALVATEERSGFLGNQCVTAMATVALETIDGAPSVFTL